MLALWRPAGLGSKADKRPTFCRCTTLDKSVSCHSLASPSASPVQGTVLHVLRKREQAGDREGEGGRGRDREGAREREGERERGREGERVWTEHPHTRLSRTHSSLCTHHIVAQGVARRVCIKHVHLNVITCLSVCCFVFFLCLSCLDVLSHF